MALIDSNVCEIKFGIEFFEVLLQVLFKVFYYILLTFFNSRTVIFVPYWRSVKLNNCKIVRASFQAARPSSKQQRRKRKRSIRSSAESDTNGTQTNLKYRGTSLGEALGRSLRGGGPGFRGRSRCLHSQARGSGNAASEPSVRNGCKDLPT